MQVVSALPKEDVPAPFLHELWAYKCLMTSSAFLTLTKHGSLPDEANQAAKILQHGAVRRSPVPAFLLQARNAQLLDNNQATSFLDKADDEPSIGREVIVALGFYAHQAYKDFYLLAMGLVAACKAQVEQLKDQGISDIKNQAYFNLTYAYYLKAFAECTFLAARRQDIVL